MSVLTMTIGFTNCDDNKGISSSIIGTWIYEENYGDDEYYYEEITIKTNGTFICKWEEYYNGDYYSDTVKGTYEIDGDEIIIELDDYITIATIVSVTSNKLIIENEDGEKSIYHRD